MFAVRESNEISPYPRLLLSIPSPGFDSFFSAPVKALDANMTGFESCKITAPSPFLDALVCNVVSLLRVEVWKSDVLGNFLLCLEKSNMHRFRKLEFSVLSADLL